MTLTNRFCWTVVLNPKRGRAQEDSWARFSGAVAIEVKDCGAGIPRETKSQILNSSFTAKKELLEVDANIDTRVLSH